MLRQNQIKLQDIKAYVRTCDRQSKQGPEVWAQQEANAFPTGTLVFLLEPAKRPPGMSTFATKNQTESPAADTFRVKDMAVVVDQVEGKAWVLNVTPSAYELRFLDTLFKEKATKAILEGVDFNYLIATPRGGLDDSALKEMRQMANLYSAGGSRRSLAQNQSGPEEPAKAILGFLGVDWSKGPIKPVIELGVVCHLIFAPDGQDENPLRSVIKGIFTPILATDNLGQAAANGTSQEGAPPPMESTVPSPFEPVSEQQPAEPAAPLTSTSIPEQGFASLTGLKTVDEKKGDTVFAPVDPSAQAPPAEATPDPFAPLDSPVAQEGPGLSSYSDEDLNKPTVEMEKPSTPDLLTSADSSNEVETKPSPEAPQKAAAAPQEPEDYVPAWYLLTHDIDEMNEVGKKKAIERFVPPEPQEKVDYSDQFFSDFQDGKAGSAAIEHSEQQMLEDQARDVESKYAPASADEASEIEHFNDDIFAQSGAKSSMEINPDAEVKAKPVEPPVTPPPEPSPQVDLFKPIEGAPDTEGNLFEKLTNELASETPNLQGVQDNQGTDQKSAEAGSGPPTNLMDMLTADSDVFTTSSAKTADPQAPKPESSPQNFGQQDNYDDLADALSGLIDSRSAPSLPGLQTDSTAQDTPASAHVPDTEAPVSFGMDMPQALTESGAHPVFKLDESQSLMEEADTQAAENEAVKESAAPQSANFFDDAEDDFDSEMEAFEDVSEPAPEAKVEETYEETHKEPQHESQPEPDSALDQSESESLKLTGEISMVDIRPELTLSEGSKTEEGEAATEPQPPGDAQPEQVASEAPVIEEEVEKAAIITPPPPPAPEVQPEAQVETQEESASLPESQAVLSESAPEQSAEAPEAEIPEQPVSDTAGQMQEETPAQEEPGAPEEQVAIITPPPAPSEPEAQAEPESLPEPVTESVSEQISEAEPVPQAEVEEPAAAIITPPPPKEEAPALEAEAEAKEEEGDTQEETKKKPIMLGTSRTRSPLLKPSGKGIKRATAKPVTADTEEAEEAKPEEQAAEDAAALAAAGAVATAGVIAAGAITAAGAVAAAAAAAEEEAQESEEVQDIQPQDIHPQESVESQPEEESPVPEQPAGPALEPKLVISESARFMARLNQRLADADKNLARKAETANEHANARIAEHLDNCERVEKDRANSSQALAAKHTRQLESIASQVKSRINETAGDATAELNAVINQAEQEIEQVKQELISTLRYAEHRARSDSESLQSDSQKGIDNHIQERSQEFRERTEYVCSILEQAANEHVELAEKRFEKFKSRMQDELNSIIASLERNVNSMNEEIDGSWERASSKLQANQKEFENTTRHHVRDCQLKLDNKVKSVYVEQVLPRLIDNKAIFRTMLFDMKKNYEEQSDRIITEHLSGLESNIKNAQEELKVVISKCHSSIDEVGRGQQAGLEELFDNTSSRMQEITQAVKTRLDKARTNLEHNQEICTKVAEYSPEQEDPGLSEERSYTRSSIQTSCKDAEASLEQAISSGCAKLDSVSEDLQHRLTRQREDWTGKVKQSSDDGISRVKRAIQEAYQAIEQAKDKHME